MQIPSRALLYSLALALYPSLSSAIIVNGSAVTERYWDCCKPSCAWREKGPVNQPVKSCDIRGNPLSSFDAGTGCNGGDAFACNNQQPWAVNDTFSYGFTGTYIIGHVEDFWCCACWELTFTAGAIAGKKMVVQTQNTVYDETHSHKFTLAMPAGNRSDADGCARQYSMPADTFGALHEGVSSRSDCDKLPKALKDGCYWRFDWFADTEKPTADFKRVVCPAELTNITGCFRHDEQAVGLPGSAAPVSAPHRVPIVVATAIYIISILLY